MNGKLPQSSRYPAETHTHTREKRGKREKNNLLLDTKRNKGEIYRGRASVLCTLICLMKLANVWLLKLKSGTAAVSALKNGIKWYVEINYKTIYEMNWCRTSVARLGWTGWDMRSGSLFWFVTLLYRWKKNQFLRFKLQCKSEITRLEVSVATLMHLFLVFMQSSPSRGRHWRRMIESLRQWTQSVPILSRHCTNAAERNLSSILCSCLPRRNLYSWEAWLSAASFFIQPRHFFWTQILVTVLTHSSFASGRTLDQSKSSR